MTKYELIKALEPFSDDVKIIMADGRDVTSADYMMSDDGEGFIVISDADEEDNEN